MNKKKTIGITIIVIGIILFLFAGYKLLNSKFDSYNGEAYYNDKMEPVVEELKEKGLLKESQGAQVVDLEKYDMPPCIIITSAGTTIYATRDLASLKDRMNTYDFDKAIYVVGNEQALHFKQVFKVFELMGYEDYASKCVHVPFGLVVDKNGEKIGSRKGNSVFLEDILNEAIDKVKDIINEKNPELEDKEEVARKVGVGAIIFNDLSNSRIKDEIFDWDMLLNFQGETGPYIQYIYVRTRSLLNKAGYMPNIDSHELENYIEIPPNSDLGDYAFPCFKLAKELRKAPPMIANDIKENIKIDENIIEKIEVVGGYLNIYINKQTLAKEVLEAVAKNKEKYGSSTLGEGKNVVIDYSAPNIAKPFHIGHLRSTVIGGALYKIYNFLGYNSVGINFLGDWGLQFGKVMAGIKLWKDEYDFKNDEMSSILKTYIRFNKEEKENPELTDLARAEFRKLEDGDQETYKLWEHIRKISLENYEKTYKLLNSKFDSYNGEAYYNDKMEPVVAELKEKGLLKESQGAQVVDLEKYNMPPCIIITSAGTTIYATRELASLKDRMNTYNFDKAIYVVGNEQSLHFKQVFKVFELMGYEDYAKNCVHVPFGLVVDKDGEKIGSRKGNSVFLEDILNEAIDKVKDIINEKNPKLENKEEVARKVGVGAIIFNDLSNSRIKDEIFDWDMLLNFQGETGPYIQYIYVRTRSILNKAGYMPKIEEINFSKITEKEALDTLKLIYQFNDVVKNAAEKNEPSILARYLIDLSQSFSTYYNEHRIITEDKEVQDARLFLTYAVGTVLKTGAELLGMEMPERM